MPPDVPACVEITNARAHCTKIISGEQFEINDSSKFEGKTYWEMRPTMLLFPASSWRKIKSYTITACRRNGNCGDEIGSWDRILETIDAQVKKKE